MISLSIITNLLNNKINHNYIVTQTFKKYRKNKNCIHDCMAYKTHDHRSHSAVVSEVQNNLKKIPKKSNLEFMDVLSLTLMLTPQLLVQIVFC